MPMPSTEGLMAETNEQVCQSTEGACHCVKVSSQHNRVQLSAFEKRVTLEIAFAASSV